VIIIGGIEASLRRLAHYDYWDNKIRRSILLDSSADLLVYGMAEKSIIEVADSLDNQIPVEELTYIKGTVYKTKDKERAYGYQLPSFEQVKSDPKAYADRFSILTKETHFALG